MAEPQAQSPTFSIQGSGTTPAAEPQVSEAAMTEVNATGMPRTYANKYRSVEDLEKGYKELETRLGQKFPETSQMDVGGILTKAGLSNEDLVTNWSNDGRLSDDQYAKLQNVGFSRSVVDTFLHGQFEISQSGGRQQQEMQRVAYDMAGGAEQYDNLAAWAASHYPPAKVEEMNARLNQPLSYEGAIKEMLFDYKQEVGAGFSRPLVNGTSMPNTATGFTNVEELVTAVRQARMSGRYDESLKRRIANTPQHILEGVDR